MAYSQRMKPKHAMTFQAATVGTVLVLLALVGRSEAAYANGVYIVICGGLYGSYRIMTRSPFRPIPPHRQALDTLVERQTLGAGAAGLLALSVVSLADLGPYHVTRILAVVLAAAVIGALIVFLSSLVDWWWILPRISGILRPAPCQCAGGESWPGLTSIWLFHRGLATIVVSGALTAVPAYMGELHQRAYRDRLHHSRGRLRRHTRCVLQRCHNRAVPVSQPKGTARRPCLSRHEIRVCDGYRGERRKLQAA
jgi:hypothetical protein